MKGIRILIIVLFSAIGGLLLNVFRYTQLAIRYAGMFVFFAYAFFVMLPLVILLDLSYFVKNPSRVIENTVDTFHDLVDKHLL
nr:MAG TPA: hypothetical protein [Caudoviricetes sp.]